MPLVFKGIIGLCSYMSNQHCIWAKLSGRIFLPPRQEMNLNTINLTLKEMAQRMLFPKDAVFYCPHEFVEKYMSAPDQEFNFRKPMNMVGGRQLRS